MSQVIKHVSYHLGNLISKPMCRFGWCAFLYPLYNKLMLYAFDIK